MKIHRLMTMLLLLESRGTIKARELAKLLEVSTRTIYRDAEDLAESGIPVYAETGPDGGFSLMDGYTAGINSLGSDDIVNLFLGGMGIPSGADTDTVNRLTKTLALLHTSLAPEYQADIDKAENCFYFDPEPWWHKRPILIGFDRIRQALWNGKKLDTRYGKPNGEESRRILHPLGLVVKQTSWYLVAWCETRKEVRVFRCERFLAVTMMDETFERPADFNLRTFWQEHNERFLAEANPDFTCADSAKKPSK
jgi:predicted DNA-binding transcriptional regulator YafY